MSLPWIHILKPQINLYFKNPRLLPSSKFLCCALPSLSEAPSTSPKKPKHKSPILTQLQRTMKLNRQPIFWALLLSALLLSACSRAVPTTRSMRFSPQEGKKERHEKLGARLGDPTRKEETMFNLMEDKCNDGRDVEECLKARIITEAHLDYIYTQDVNP